MLQSKGSPETFLTLYAVILQECFIVYLPIKQVYLEQFKNHFVNVFNKQLFSIL